MFSTSFEESICLKSCLYILVSITAYFLSRLHTIHLSDAVPSSIFSLALLIFTPASFSFLPSHCSFFRHYYPCCFVHTFCPLKTHHMPRSEPLPISTTIDTLSLSLSLWVLTVNLLPPRPDCGQMDVTAASQIGQWRILFIHVAILWATWPYFRTCLPLKCRCESVSISVYMLGASS